MTSLIAGVFTFAFILLIFLISQMRSRAKNEAAVVSILDAYSSEDLDQLVQKSSERKVNWIDSFGRLIISARYQKRIRERLTATGKQGLDAYNQSVRQKVIGSIVGLSLGLLTQFDAGLNGVLIIGLATAAGFFLPDVLIYNAGTKRSTVINQTLPDAIDILSLCVESGLTFQASMGQVSTILEGPIADEFARVLRQMQLGQSLVVSLQDMSLRNKNDDLSRFVTVIIQADKLGIPISSVLNEQGREMRGKRRDRAREQAQKVPVKILMPVMFCFLPGIFIVILGPAMVSIARALSGV